MTAERHGPELERPALDVFYRTERWWGRAAAYLSSFGALLVVIASIASSEYRAPGIVLLALSIPCQLISWRAMRAAQRLEQRRIARLVEQGPDAPETGQVGI